MKNSILILLLIVLAATNVAAQDAISPILGKDYTYLVEDHVGSTFVWEVLTATSPYTSANSSDYQITAGAAGSQLTIQWLSAGSYLLVVTETDFSGCTNKKALALEVNASSFYVSYPSLSNTLCFSELEDGISIPVSLTGSGGDALDESAFPITLAFTVDGVAQTSQQINFADQSLIIDDSNISGSGSVDRTYEITLTGAADAQNQTIQPQEGQDTFELTLLAQPQFSFAKSTFELVQGDQQAFSVNSSGSFTYEWKLVLPDGSELVLSSKSETSDEALFDQVGVYLVQVRAKAANSCYSEWQQLSISVVADEDEPDPDAEATPILAIDDINQGWKNELLYGNVLTNDFHDTGTLQVKVISIPDSDAGKLTAFNTKTGAYTFEPAADYTGDLQFEYQLCETATDGTQSCSNAFVDIQILETDFTSAIPSAVDKYFAVAAGSTLSGNFLTGDFDLNGGVIQVSDLNFSDLGGNFSYQGNGSFTYAPADGFTGAETFSYKACSSSCDWATVTIYVLGDEFALEDLLAGDAAFYNSGILTTSLPANKRTDGAADYTYAIATNGSPQHGTVLLNDDGTFTYTPSAGQIGYFTDQFVYEISTLAGESYATAYISSYIEEPVAIVKSEFETGACVSAVLDASKSTGLAPLTYSWSPGDYLSDASSSAPIFYPGESSTYTLTVTDALGNTNTRTVNVVVAPAPDVVAEAYVFVENSTESILLDASASIGSNLTYSWTSASSGVIVSGQDSATPEVKGVGKYYVNITDEYGCMDQDSVIVGIWIQAVDDEAQALVNNYVSINVLRNDVPQGDLNPASVSIISPPSNGMVEVRTDSTIVYTPDQEFVGQDNFVYQVCTYLNKCDEATVLVVVNEEALFIPNAFTPNGDGYNDYFEIKGLRKYDNVNLKIFNRWGNLVYQSTHYGENGYWDGVANVGVRIGNGPVASGTYFYSLSLGEGQEKLSGFVYIER